MSTTTSGVVNAVNPDGVEREFSKTQWAEMGQDAHGHKPGGWKVQKPAEADPEHAKLVAARINYKQVTGNDAPANLSADYLNGQASAFEMFRQMQTQVPAPTAPSPDAAQAEQNAQELKANTTQTPDTSTPPVIGDDGHVNGDTSKQETDGTGNTSGTDTSDKKGDEQKIALTADNVGSHTKENYKRPRSTEDARNLYLAVLSKEAPAEMKFGEMVTAIEEALGVVHEAE